ncbi:hypothetical protein JCM11641_000352 [Rhodosporidiobolus odoratus]
MLQHLILPLLLLASPFAVTHPEGARTVHTNHVFEGFGEIGRLGLALEAKAHNGFRRVRRRVDLAERAMANPKKAAVANYYTALVAIGASYTDNAHSRDSAYAGSLRNYWPYNKYGGRYSNGPVAVEYMVDSSVSPALKQTSSGIKLLDYAYGGSVVQNGLSGTSSSWPAAKDQIASYLSDLKSGSASVGSGRVLHYFNSGINPVSQIWYNTISSGMSTSAIAKASAAVTANTKAAAAALRTIATDSAVHASVHGSDFLIAGIPQLDLVPTFAHQIPSSYSSSQRSQAIALLKTLSDQWNSEMRTFTAALKGEVKNERVFWYDMAALWSSMHSSSKSYGITASPVTSTCYNSSTGGVCTSPSNYLYFDTLHPVTSVHKLTSGNYSALVAFGASYTDNAHDRSSSYSGTLRNFYPYNKFSGRYSNGPVAVEQMVDSSTEPALPAVSGGAKLLDYAYGGSVISNGLAGTSSGGPGAKDQIASYLSDLKGNADTGKGRVLHYFNSGINPVAQIWTNAVNSGLSSSAKSTAKANVKSNTDAMAKAMQSIENDSNVKSLNGADYLLVGIPQMEIVPSFGYQIPSSFSSSKKEDALDFLKTLSDQWNEAVEETAEALADEIDGKAFFFDLADLWVDMHDSPDDYGVTVDVKKACYDSSSGDVCSKPETYLYFDTLHPVTSIHKVMAERMNALVTGKITKLASFL